MTSMAWLSSGTVGDKIVLRTPRKLAVPRRGVGEVLVSLCEMKMLTSMADPMAGV